ncbi:type II toxin-antitoxin system HipA family toxin [Campylobacter fetus]|uniref:type II toxin-antitoxin system HipA family toxin n=1 Tax=Campylobacter fetus TaxID=196 RepID=UPI003AF88C59
MSLKAVTIAILDILLSKKQYLSLKEISLSLTKFNITDRQILNEITALMKTNRLVKDGIRQNSLYAASTPQKAHQNSRFIYVFKNRILAGILFEIPDGFLFYYTNDYLVSGLEAVPTMPLSIQPFSFSTIPPFFDQNIPEGINLEILKFQLNSSDALHILASLSDPIGDISFSFSPKTAQSQISNPSYLSNLEKILSDNPKINILKDFYVDIPNEILFPENYDLSKLELAQNDGISGFQYKKLVNIDFERKIIHQDAASNYILKPYSKIRSNPTSQSYFPHIAINEHLHLSFAKNTLKIRVPWSAVVAGDDEYHYVIKRFDKLENHHYNVVEFASYLGLTSINKYDTTSEKLFKRISKELLSDTEKKELLKIYVYSVIIKYEDLHAKNLSLITSGDIVLMAPMYDVMSTGFYSTAKGFESYLPINGKRQNIRLNDFKPLCKILNVDFKEFKQIAFSIANSYKDEFSSYIDLIKPLNLKFYKQKLVKRVGDESFLVPSDKYENLSTLLEQFHTKRVEELKFLGWIQ